MLNVKRYFQWTKLTQYPENTYTLHSYKFKICINKNSPNARVEYDSITFYQHSWGLRELLIVFKSQKEMWNTHNTHKKGLKLCTYRNVDILLWSWHQWSTLHKAHTLGGDLVQWSWFWLFDAFLLDKISCKTQKYWP